MSKPSRIEKLLGEIVEDWPTRYYVQIDSDSHNRWTVTLFYAPNIWTASSEVTYWHSDDLEQALKWALIAKQAESTGEMAVTNGQDEAQP